MIRIPEEGVLFGGDAEYEDYYDNDSQYDKNRLAAFIEYLKKTDFRFYMRGHDDTAVSKEEIIGLLTDSLAAL